MNANNKSNKNDIDSIQNDGKMSAEFIKSRAEEFDKNDTSKSTQRRNKTLTKYFTGYVHGYMELLSMIFINILSDAMFFFCKIYHILHVISCVCM